MIGLLLSVLRVCLYVRDEKPYTDTLTFSPVETIITLSWNETQFEWKRLACLLAYYLFYSLFYFGKILLVIDDANRVFS